MNASYRLNRLRKAYQEANRMLELLARYKAMGAASIPDLERELKADLKAIEREMKQLIDANNGVVL